MDTRGRTKIRQAVGAFNFDFRGKIVLDIGSSTGGFTEYAFEKGTNQMMAPLKFSPKVDLHEKTDIFDVTGIEEPDVILADVSFVSLKKILTHVKSKIAGPKTEFLVMLKPQFEAKPNQLWNGVVKNEKMRREIIKDFEQFLKQNGFLILKKHDNELTGKTGNRERFYLLKLSKN